MFFGANRAAFLEYLRNLTPQILFLTAALVALAPLDTRQLRLDWEGCINFLRVFVCGAVFLGAFAASISKFLDDVLQSTEDLDIELQRLRARYKPGVQLLRSAVAAAWRLNRSAFLQVGIAVVVVQASGIAITMMAAQTAIGVLRST